MRELTREDNDGTVDRLTPAAKPGQTGDLLAPFPSPESADQNKPRERNEPSGPEENAREGTPGRSLFPAWLRRLRYYGLALLFVAVAVTLRWALWDVLSPAPSLVFYLAWVGAAAFGGLGPGLLATLASWLCVELLFDSTPGQLGFSDPMSIARLLVLLAGGLVVSVVGEKMRRTRIRERRQGRELAELAQSLDREKKILQSVMNGAKNSHLVYLDRDFNFVRVNATYARTCGYTPEEMVGKNHFVLYPHAENEALFSRVKDTGVPVEVHDKPFVFPDQPERGVTYWDWTLTPVKNDSGYVEGLVFSLFETTRRKQAEEAIKQQADLLNLTLDTIFMCDARDRIRSGIAGRRSATAGRRPRRSAEVTHTLLATHDFPSRRRGCAGICMRTGSGRANWYAGRRSARLDPWPAVGPYSGPERVVRRSPFWRSTTTSPRTGCRGGPAGERGAVPDTVRVQPGWDHFH